MHRPAVVPAVRHHGCVQVGGLSCVRIGSGPPVLFVHGWAGLKEGWAGLPRAIADAGFQAILIDLPGWGESPAPRGFPHTPESYGTALERALIEIGPASIIAHSMGAQGTLVLAIHRPRLVDKLVLLGPTLTPYRPATFPPKSHRDVVRYRLLGVPLTRLSLLWLRRDKERWRQSFLRAFAEPERLVGDPELEQTLAVASTTLTTTSTRTLACSAPPLLDFDARSWLHGVPQPTLGVIGDRDRVAVPGPAEESLALMRNARTMRVSGVAHFPHIEAEAPVTAAIIEHLSR